MVKGIPELDADAQYTNLALSPSLAASQSSSSNTALACKGATEDKAILSPTISSSSTGRIYSAMELNKPPVELPAQSVVIVGVASANNLEPMSTTSSQPCTTNYWKIIPYEIREKIFEEVANLKTEKNEPYFKPVVSGKLPALLIGLEPLPHVREQAFKHFRISNGDFYLLRGFNWFEDMKKAELETVRYVELDIHLGNRLRPNGSILRPYEPHQQYAKHFDGMPNILGVKLKLSYFDLRKTEVAERFVCEFPFWLKAFKSLDWVEVEIPELDIKQRAQDEYFQSIRGRIEAEFGIKKVAESSADRSSVRKVKNVRWEIDDGEDDPFPFFETTGMDWSTNDIGFLWYQPLESLFLENRNKFPGVRKTQVDGYYPLPHIVHPQAPM